MQRSRTKWLEHLGMPCSAWCSYLHHDQSGSIRAYALHRVRIGLVGRKPTEAGTRAEGTAHVPRRPDGPESRSRRLASSGAEAQRSALGPAHSSGGWWWETPTPPTPLTLSLVRLRAHQLQRGGRLRELPNNFSFFGALEIAGRLVDFPTQHQLLLPIGGWWAQST